MSRTRIGEEPHVLISGLGVGGGVDWSGRSCDCGCDLRTRWSRLLLLSWRKRAKGWRLQLLWLWLLRCTIGNLGFREHGRLEVSKREGRQIFFMPETVIGQSSHAPRNSPTRGKARCAATMLFYGVCDATAAAKSAGKKNPSRPSPDLDVRAPCNAGEIEDSCLTVIISVGPRSLGFWAGDWQEWERAGWMWWMISIQQGVIPR
jgi:hypothetical protein